VLALCGALLGMAPAQAHLMSAQKGTLNLVGDAAFLVLSMPVSALSGVDDDGDGGLSTAEMQAHAATIRAQVAAGVQLLGPSGALPLQLVMVDGAPPDNAPAAAASHLVVMGRFQLRTPEAGTDSALPAVPDPLSLRFTLFGATASEQRQDLTITRRTDSQWLRFVPERPTQVLLPSASAVLGEYVRTGATHVLGGADHLLFLLVVLAAGWRWRGLLGALTGFTAGHALTLAICVRGGWSAPAAVVEPAIAATIVAMAAFDAWARWRARSVQAGVRLALVFACALIHGLGLAGALTELTHWAPGTAQMAWALAGFNLGIELAQIGVAVLAGVIALGWCGLAGPGANPVAHRLGRNLASATAMAAGAFWFVERVVQSA
jgi:hypothetical protein